MDEPKYETRRFVLSAILKKFWKKKENFSSKIEFFGKKKIKLSHIRVGKSFPRSDNVRRDLRDIGNREKKMLEFFLTAIFDRKNEGAIKIWIFHVSGSGSSCNFPGNLRVVN